jgi:hypothetical protein
MRDKRRIHFLIFFLILFLNFLTTVEADINKKYTEIKAGFIGPGSAGVDDAEFDTKTGFSLGFVFEKQRDDNFITGFTIDLDEIKAEGTDERSLMANFSFIIKKDHSTSNKKVSLRPGVAVGIALLDEIGVSEFKRIDKTALLTLRFIGEIAFRAGPTSELIGELSIFWAPYGRDNVHNISGGPMLVFRAGIRF